MDHRQIEELQYVERYLASTLGEAETERFEEHYLSCETCQDELELGMRLRRGLEAELGDVPAVAAGEVPGSVVVLQPDRMARARRLVRSRPAAMLAAAALVVLLLPTTLLMVRLQQVGASLEASRRQADRAAEQAKALMQEARQLRTELDHQRELAAADQQTRQAQQPEQIESQVREAVTRRLAAEHRPRVNTPILRLGAVRSTAAGAQATSGARLELGDEPEWIVLVADLGAADAGGGFEAALLDRQGALVWKGTCLVPDGSGSLVVSLHSSTLAAGRYQLLVRPEGPDPGVPERFTFELSRGPAD